MSIASSAVDRSDGRELASRRRRRAPAIVGLLDADARRRRSRSMARLRAVVVIHAPGLSGTPRSGQVSSALMNASWTASSARSKSPRTRMSVATARPCSSRNRRSTISWAASAPVNARVGR